MIGPPWSGASRPMGTPQKPTLQWAPAGSLGSQGLLHTHTIFRQQLFLYQGIPPPHKKNSSGPRPEAWGARDRWVLRTKHYYDNAHIIQLFLFFQNYTINHNAINDYTLWFTSNALPAARAVSVACIRRETWAQTLRLWTCELSNAPHGGKTQVSHFTFRWPQIAPCKSTRLSQLKPCKLQQTCWAVGHLRRAPRCATTRLCDGSIGISERVTHLCRSNKPNQEGGDDTVGNPHRAQISQFELFKLILFLKLGKQYPVEAIQCNSISVNSTLPPLNQTKQGAAAGAISQAQRQDSVYITVDVKDQEAYIYLSLSIHIYLSLSHNMYIYIYIICVYICIYIYMYIHIDEHKQYINIQHNKSTYINTHNNNQHNTTYNINHNKPT